MNKEITFTKQIERTAKRDAYLAAARYIKQFGLEYGMRIIVEKARGHTEYLDELPLAYDYATQTLVPKSDAIDGEKVDAFLTELGGGLRRELEKPEAPSEQGKTDGK
jgi:hypothetical protein